MKSSLAVVMDSKINLLNSRSVFRPPFLLGEFKFISSLFRCSQNKFSRLIYKGMTNIGRAMHPEQNSFQAAILPEEVLKYIDLDKSIQQIQVIDSQDDMGESNDNNHIAPSTMSVWGTGAQIIEEVNKSTLEKYKSIIFQWKTHEKII